MISKGVRNQLLSTICVNILSFGVGAAMVWTSPYLAHLKSPETPLSRPITTDEASTIGGLLPLGALIGALIFGWAAEKVGRFCALYIVAVPGIIWWFIAVYTTDLYVLYFGRFLSGIYAGGTYSLVPLYVAEISQDKVRGSLGSFFIFGLDVGMLIIYVFGAYLKYETVQIIFLCIMAVFIVILAFLPDTPISLMRRGKPEAAADAMKFFRGLGKDEMINGDISLEIQLMKMNIEENAKTHRGLRNLLDATSIKAIIFGILLISFHQFSGVPTFIGYAADIFRESGSSFSPNTSAIIVGVQMNVGALISVFVMDKFNRKLLYFITTMGNIFGLILMGFYGFFGQFYDVNDFKIIPVIALSIVILFVSIARVPLTYVITAEIQPQRTRSFGIAICSSVSWFCAFIMMKYFASLVELITLHNLMFLFAVLLVISQVFVTFLVPETKNKSFEEIERDMK